MKKLFFSSLLLLFLLPAFGQFPLLLEKKLNWLDQTVKYSPYEALTLEALYFEGAQYNDKHPGLPFFGQSFDLPGPGDIRVTLVDASWEQVADVPEEELGNIAESLQFLSSVAQDRRQYKAGLAFVPLRKINGSRVEKLVNFTLKVEFTPGVAATTRGPETTDQSVLANGEVYKVAVSRSGMHKMTYDFLRDLGVPVDDIDPRKIQLFGNGGGPLPEPVSAFRYDDLEENPIQVEGEEDGSFDPGDFVLFYAEAADKWLYNPQGERFDMVRNPYSDKNFYFIKIESENGLRLDNLPDAALVADYTTNAFDDYQRLEEDKFNLLFDYSSTQGSGQEWFGDNFRIVRERTYADIFSFPNILTNEPAHLQARFAGRSGSTSRFYAGVGGEEYSASLSGVNTGNSLGTYARAAVASGNFTPVSSDIDVGIRYPEVAQSSEGWLDYIQINARRELRMVGNELQFRDIRSIGADLARYTINRADANLVVWDVTDPVHPQRQNGKLGGDAFTFTAQVDTLHQYVAFRTNAPLNRPEAVGKVTNQNIHGVDNVDLVILFHPDFESAASRLADHRSSFSDLNVAMVRIDELYNEFSSGRQDPVAIRDFARMLFERSDRFKYLLLFGDASFDFRNRLELSETQRHHFVPTYQTRGSFDPIESFPTDDYFALLSPGEGDNLKGALDIAVGRLPVKTASEASAVVDKIIQYDTNPEQMRDWRNRIGMVADDEDSGTHFGGADRISRMIEKEHPTYNINKIYFDAFQQVATPGGARFPDVKSAINQNMFKGLLVLNYLGHGGSTGWAQERVLLSSDIVAWNNLMSPTLLVTATCSFTGFDEPNYETGGELSLLNKNGGAIGLYTTTRAVYAYSNERLTTAAFEFLLKKVDGAYVPIGEVLRLSKNDNKEDTLLTNARKFAVIGDPSMYLAIPNYQVMTSTINGKAIGSPDLDTLKALSKVTIEGFVADENGSLLSDFNGVVYPTIYDKRDTLQTLGQDKKSPVRSFSLQKNIIFRGAASVENGRFSFSFVVPKDIDYSLGYGKISYYAQDGERDATGYFNEVVIGGTSPEAINDEEGPVVEVFMNNESFVFGGMTNEDPTLLVKLFDDNGINVVGTSIGHDLTGTLDDDLQNTYILNDFYEAVLDDYRQGIVRYPLYDIEEGRHRISVKAWDVANNSSTGFTEFVVASSEEVALEFVLNYPNPFTTNTWFEFKHNRSAGEVLDVQVQIYTISGKLVKTLRQQLVSNGDRVSRADGIQWDGTDDYGDQLARGVYLYRVKLGVNDLSNNWITAESEFEKLVILK
jgi:hypothetical protein